MNTFRYFYLILKTFSDYVVLALCFLFSLAVVKTQFGINVDELVRTRDLLFLFLLLIGWFYSARVVGLYDEFRSRSRVFEFKALLQVVLMQAFCGITFAFVLKLGYIGQLFLLLYCGSLLSMLVLWKLSLNTILNFLRKNGRNLRRFIIVGNGEKSKQFCQLIIDNPHLGYQMAGYVDDIDRSATQGALYRGAIASI
jgi:putative colanic acid biosynthesis UDP-glucose lipid carrier transferase